MPGTPLIKKLHVKPGHRMLILGAPEGYLDLLGPLPDGAKLLRRAGRELDFVQLFVRSAAELARRAPKALAAARHDAVLWICYPKKSSKVKSDLQCNQGFGPVYDAGLDSVAIISIDDTWSAMRFRPAKR